jgi:hypothetical protein
LEAPHDDDGRCYGWHRRNEDDGEVGKLRGDISTWADDNEMSNFFLPLQRTGIITSKSIKKGLLLQIATNGARLHVWWDLFSSRISFFFVCLPLRRKSLDFRKKKKEKSRRGFSRMLFKAAGSEHPFLQTNSQTPSHTYYIGTVNFLA